MDDSDMLNKYREIQEFPGYFVSKDGEFISRKDLPSPRVYYRRGHIKYVSFKVDNVWIKKSAARLVADLFVPIPQDLSLNKSTLLIDYIDNDQENISSNNLRWMTPSDLQRKAFIRRIYRFRENHPGSWPNDINDRYPNAVVCPSWPGYYYLPHVMTKVGISKCGDLIDLETGKRHPTRLDSKGYVTTSLYNSDFQKYRTVIVHRLVARLFCPIPDRHQDKNYDDLQVNHKNGIKTDNRCDNLEWVTNAENMKHARDSNLFDNEVGVLSKNLQTGEVIRHKSLSECSRIHLMNIPGLSEHVRSESAGMIPKNDHVFKLDDGSPWPRNIAAVDSRDKFYIHCDIVAHNVQTNESHIFVSISQACSFLGLNLNVVRNTRTRKGCDHPYDGWIFTTLADRRCKRRT